MLVEKLRSCMTVSLKYYVLKIKNIWSLCQTFRIFGNNGTLYTYSCFILLFRWWLSFPQLLDHCNKPLEFHKISLLAYSRSAESIYLYLKKSDYCEKQNKLAYYNLCFFFFYRPFYHRGHSHLKKFMLF